MTIIKEYFAKASNKFTNSDAKIIGPVLGELAEKGPVSARDLLEIAHSTNSPLHTYFEWDDKRAAEAHRLSIAREMVRTIKVRVIYDDRKLRQPAAQRISVKSHHLPPERVPTVVQKFPQERSEQQVGAIASRSLDDNYWPDHIEEAIDIIYDLRARVKAAFGDNEIGPKAEFGMTGKETKVYQFLKRKGFANKGEIYFSLYGEDGCVEPKIVDVFICKLRKKLPPNEIIETIWGVGYKLVEQDETDLPTRRFEGTYDLNPAAVRGLSDDHRAIQGGHTLFPTTVTAVKDSPRLLVSGANSRKLGDRVTKGPWAGFPIFQLSLEERATCPRSCFHWKTCYGNGMQFARRHKNDENLIPYLRAELVDMQDEFPRGFVVRLHVLGDFYSPEYVAVWKKFLNDFPALHVFGYTAWSKDSEIGAALKDITDKQWDRFAIRFSSGEPQEQGATTIWRMPEDDRVWEGIVCPAQTGKTACCGTCGLCWAATAKTDTIAFIAHGPKSSAPIKGPTKAELMGRR
jgi:hypothetical protein